MRQKRSLFLVCVLVLAVCIPAAAQKFTADVRGTVTGALTGTEAGPVAGASVTILNLETGLERTVQTNAAGLYAFSNLPVGTYILSITADGFQPYTVQNVALNVADTREINAELSLGEEVTVTSSAIVVETIGGEVAGLITGEQIRELPLNGRNLMQLTQLMPGVTTLDNFNFKNKGPASGSDMSVSGGSVTSNAWSVDGANNNDVGSNRTVLIYPSLEALEEFKIHRNSYGAEFGGAGGAQVNLVTRGGTNEIKGSVFYFRRDDAYNEANYILRQANADKEPLSRDDYGYTFGGAIKKDKLHYFLSQEWNDEARGVAVSARVPTALEQQGDFSQSDPACAPIPIDPLTGQRFPGDVIPQDRQSAAGQAYLQLYPVANISLDGTCTNWVDALTTPIDWAQINARADWNVNDKTRFMMRYTEDEWENPGPTAGSANGLWGDDPFPAVDSSWTQPSSSLVAQVNQVIGSAAINTVTFSMSGNEINIGNTGTNPDVLDQINATHTAVFQDDKTANPRGHPVFWANGQLPDTWNAGPWNNEQDLMVLKDDYERVFGDHVFKAGLLVSDNNKKQTSGVAAAEATAYWGATGIGGWGATSGNTIADFLIDGMAFAFGEASFAPRVDTQWEDLEVYVADSWKIRDNLTLDYGVRYSRFDWPYDSDPSKWTSFNPDRFDAALGASPCNGLMQAPGADPCGDAGFAGGSVAPNKALINDDTDNFAPRLGLAWDVFEDGDSVVRVGFGKFYQRERNEPNFNMATNPPAVANTGGLRTFDGSFQQLDFVGFGRPQNGWDVNAETPYNLQFNVTWEQRVGRDSSVEVGYVGSRGRHLMRSNNINYVRDGDFDGNGVNDRLDFVRCPGGDGGAGCRGQFRQFSAFGDGNLTYWTTDGSSEYDSIQSQFTMRFGRGSQFQSSYTFSTFDANTGMNDSTGGLSADATTFDLDNPELDWGRSILDREHVFNASLIYGLPTFEGEGGFKEHVLGNWAVGGIVSYASGTPITVLASNPGGDLDGTAPAGVGYEDNNTPIRVAGVSCSGGGGTLQIINPAAFTFTGFRLGDSSQASGRGQCEGPDFFQVDLSAYKNLSFGERFDVQVRIEVFNVFNRTNVVGQSVNRGFDAAVTLDAPRDQATVVTDTTNVSSTFGQAFAVRDPRQVQLGVKFSF